MCGREWHGVGIACVVRGRNGPVAWTCGSLQSGWVVEVVKGWDVDPPGLVRNRHGTSECESREYHPFQSKTGQFDVPGSN
jgi:hypothetical protein